MMDPEVLLPMALLHLQVFRLLVGWDRNGAACSIELWPWPAAPTPSPRSLIEGVLHLTSAS